MGVRASRGPESRKKPPKERVTVVALREHLPTSTHGFQASIPPRAGPGPTLPATVLRGVMGQRPPPPPVLPPVQEHEPVVQRFPTPPPQAASHMVPVHLAPYDQHHIQAPGAIHPGGGPPGYPFPHFPQMNQGIPLGQEHPGPFYNIGGGQAHGRPHNPNQLSHPLHIN